MFDRMRGTLENELENNKLYKKINDSKYPPNEKIINGNGIKKKISPSKTRNVRDLIEKLESKSN